MPLQSSNHVVSGSGSSRIATNQQGILSDHGQSNAPYARFIRDDVVEADIVVWIGVFNKAPLFFKSSTNCGIWLLPQPGAGGSTRLKSSLIAVFSQSPFSLRYNLIELIENSEITRQDVGCLLIKGTSVIDEQL
jgi:hypothetical protein